ncbi:MAG: hypothetical protein Q8Q56_02205, partial [Alphaproteobacteria bacterium]|nr:hypothetical protein [Alphaproteobacteria bacterium]
EVEGLESPDPRLTEKDFICCKPFRTDGATVDVLLSIANRHALSICSLPEILNARFGESTLAEESVEKRWYNSLQLPQRKTEIAELLPLPEVTNVTALRELSERLGDATKIVEPRHGIGSLCCSEQHSLLFLRDALKEAITSCEGSPLMKALVIHVHTTKHPCRICGLNLYRELQLLNADNAFFLPDGFDQGRLVEGFRILMLLTYRESYDDLPDSSTVFSAAGRFSDLLTPFLQADHVDRIGIVELKVKNTFELREVLPTHEPEEGAAAGAGGGST